MPTKAQLESALRNADKAGDAVAAKRLANAIKAGQYSDVPVTPPPAGEVPMTFEQAQAMPRQQPVEAPSPSLGEQISGVAQAGALSTIGAIPPMIGHVVGAGQGLVEEISSGNFGSYDSARRVQQRAEEGAQRLSIEPYSETGQQYTQAVGEALAPMAGIAPHLAVESAALRAGGQAARGSRFERAKISDVRDSLAENTTESVGWKLDKSGNPTANMLERDLLDMGVKDTTLTSMRALRKQDRDSALRTLDLAEDYVRGKEGSDISRPSMVAGDRIMARFKKLSEVQDEASKRINDAVGKDLRGKMVSLDDIRDDFVFNLERRGAGVTEGSINLKDLSSFQKSDRQLLGEIYRTLNRDDIPADELHRLKRTISDRVYGSISGATPVKLSDEAQSVIKSVRGRINEKLRDMSPDYAKANDDFAAVIEPLNQFKEAVGESKFKDIIGRDIDMENTRISNFTGTQMRKMLSNYANADQIVAAVDNLNQTANRYGGGFGNEIVPLVRLNSDLESLLGSFAPQSAQGVLEKAKGAGMQRALGGMSEIAKSAVDSVMRRTSNWDAPSKQKLELINKLREQVKGE